jgi:hypothetical protein
VPPKRALELGLLVGLSVLARPDGLTLLPFALLRVALSAEKRWQRAALLGLGFLLLFIPYLAFNYQLSGDWWPNTLAAKQAEYAIERERPLWLRLAQVGGQPLIGAQILLLPGLLTAAWQGVKTKHWPALLPLAWAVTFLAAYSLRLPVIYQHGRYAMPVIPVVLAWGFSGVSQSVRLHARTMGPRLLSRAWALTIGVGWLAFWLVGADAYRTDVQIIETEMVATAHWIREHTPPTALIAAHDIGALGYWGQRDILDLAGLISPDVLPFIRDEPRLTTWLTASGAQYVVIFPDWYPHFPAPDTVDLVFQTTSPYSPQAGGTNMAVYRWLGLP